MHLYSKKHKLSYIFLYSLLSSQTIQRKKVTYNMRLDEDEKNLTLAKQENEIDKNSNSLKVWLLL